MKPHDLRGAAAQSWDQVVPGGIQRAVAHMRTVLERRITMAELVQVSGMAERTLQKQFRAFLGLPPLACLRRMRLAAAREALLEAGSDVSVTQLAARFGFDHAGRFAAEYRDCFGELPSSTLARGRESSAWSPKGSAGAGRQETQNGSAPQPRSAAVRRHVPSLAILPFTVDGGRLEERLFAEALCEQLTATLSQSHAVWVRITQHAARVPAERPCGARYGLTGRISRTTSGRVRVITRLLDLESGGAHLWGEAYDGAAADLLALQDRVVEGVACAVQPAVEGAEIGRARDKPPGDLGARDLVLRALPFVLAADLTSARQAAAMLEDAMDLAPDDAVPAALAAWCQSQIHMYGCRLERPAPECARAAQLAMRAAALDPLGDPLVLTARGAVAIVWNRREEGDALLARAQAIDPRFAWAWERSAWTSANHAESDRALDHFGRALSLKGVRAPIANCLAGIGTAHFGAGRFTEAIRWIGRAIAENPAAQWHSRMLPLCHLALGDRTAARTALDRLRSAYPTLTVTRLFDTLPYHAEGPCDAFRHYADGPFLDGLVSFGLPL